MRVSLDPQPVDHVAGPPARPRPRGTRPVPRRRPHRRLRVPRVPRPDRPGPAYTPVYPDGAPTRRSTHNWRSERSAPTTTGAHAHDHHCPITAPIDAYHFTGDVLRDGRPIPPVCQTLVHDGPLVLCAQGLHASEHPFDALAYAPGARLHRVTSGDGSGTIPITLVRVRTDHPGHHRRDRLAPTVRATVRHRCPPPVGRPGRRAPVSGALYR